MNPDHTSAWASMGDRLTASRDQAAPIAKYGGLLAILSDIAEDTRSPRHSRTARKAFHACKEHLQPLAAPYVGDGFLDEQPALERFFAETATLHLAVSLISHWCAVHNVGCADGFWDLHPEARFFSWYRLPKAVSSRIRGWAASLSNTDEMLQAFSVVSEYSLAGLRRRPLGEFFTPSDIAEHLVALAQYDPLTISEHRVIDPACGSGNLLGAVVANIVHAVRTGSPEPATAISSLNRNIHGFDVQPIAVLLTRLQLLLAGLPLLERAGLSGTSVYEALSFPHVQWRDPLSDPEQFWDSCAPFHYVVGNPPFLRLAKRRLPFVRHYEEILAGQPNLYQLFLWWAVRATRPGGRVAFLVPQSIRSGQYSSRLREAIAESCSLTAITAFEDGTRVFDGVDQRMMVLALRKGVDASDRPTVAIRVSRGRRSVNSVPASNADQNQVVWRQANGPVWCVSNEPMDYALMLRVCEGQTVLGSLREFRILNGGFVWNQHKDRLQPTDGDGRLPLLSSACIGVQEFTFPPSDNRVSERLFADTTPPLGEPTHRHVAILLKRTTPKKSGGRRIVAALLPEHFLTQYPCYFAENHVNLIRSEDTGLPSRRLQGLCAWLNSRLANFVFGMVNGSSHLSKLELELMPAPAALLTELADISSALIATPGVTRPEILEQIDEYVYRFFDLSPKEARRVAEAVPLMT